MFSDFLEDPILYSGFHCHVGLAPTCLSELRFVYPLFCFWPEVCRVMAPHLSAQEMDFLRGLLGKGLSPVQIHGRLVAQRARKDMAAPSLPNVRL